MVLPVRLPMLLINGASGIAVGMATSIPPHNLSEVVDALCALVDEPDIAIERVLEKMPGPDFPTGARIITAAERGEWRQAGRQARKERRESAADLIVKSWSSSSAGGDGDGDGDADADDDRHRSRPSSNTASSMPLSQIYSSGRGSLTLRSTLRVEQRKPPTSTADEALAIVITGTNRQRQGQS